MATERPSKVMTRGKELVKGKVRQVECGVRTAILKLVSPGGRELQFPSALDSPGWEHLVAQVSELLG